MFIFWTKIHGETLKSWISLAKGVDIMAHTLIATWFLHLDSTHFDIPLIWYKYSFGIGNFFFKNNTWMYSLYYFCTRTELSRLFYSYTSKMLKQLLEQLATLTHPKYEWKSVCVRGGGLNRLCGRQLKPKLTKRRHLGAF